MASLLLLAGQFLFILGQPPLLAIKILLQVGQTVLYHLYAMAQRCVYLFKAARGRALANRRIRIRIGKMARPRLAITPRLILPSFGRRDTTLLFLGAVLALGFVFVPYWTKSKLDQLPNPKLLSVRDIPVSTKIYDRSGILLYQIYGEENRSVVSLAQLPKYIIDATIAAEDKNFYRHLGFDPEGIVRAALANLAQNGSAQGGSTITQQLVKYALLTPEKTVQRKVKEIFLAFWAERLYNKNQILEMYLNQIPYGGAAYGIETAARTYFDKPAKELTLAEAAILAGLPSSPTTYSPFGTHPELIKERQKQVLTAMVASGFISSPQAKDAAASPLKFAARESGIKAPHFVMFVKDYLAEKYGIKTVERGGLEITTTLDYSLYETVLSAIREGVARQSSLGVGNGAALVTAPQTGEILAMVGSRDFFDLAHDGNVNVTLAPRSPGSAIKPLNYALALERGLITPAAILDDAPVTYRAAGLPDYSPANYDNKFHGRVTVRVALASSYNIPAVKVLEKNGVENFIDFAQKMGIHTWQDRSRFGLALTLGGGEVTMLDLAAAYGVFANNGVRVALDPIIKITDYKGRVIEEKKEKKEERLQIVSLETAFLISNILSDDNARAPAFGAGSVLNIPGRRVAVKTGTTSEKRDNWTIGYTPSQLVVVWVGNNDNSPMSPYLESGNTGAAPIWQEIMKKVLDGRPAEDFPAAPGVAAVSICAATGTLPCENCPLIRTEFFIRGSEPKTACRITKEDLEKTKNPENKN